MVIAETERVVIPRCSFRGSAPPLNEARSLDAADDDQHEEEEDDDNGPPPKEGE